MEGECFILWSPYGEGDQQYSPTVSIGRDDQNTNRALVEKFILQTFIQSKVPASQRYFKDIKVGIFVFEFILIVSTSLCLNTKGFDNFLTSLHFR